MRLFKRSSASASQPAEANTDAAVFAPPARGTGAGTGQPLSPPPAAGSVTVPLAPPPAGNREADSSIGAVPSVEMRASPGAWSNSTPTAPPTEVPSLMPAVPMAEAEGEASPTSEGSGRGRGAWAPEAEPAPWNAPSRDSLRGGEWEAKPEDDPRSVWVHIYNTDPYTAWLNWAGLKYADVPIYHAGIEVYGLEWAFQYFDDTWDDDTISGVTWCEPKRMGGFDYQESICLGPTSLTVAEVRVVLERLRCEWPASSYHLTRHNCLTFAKNLVELLNTRDDFPHFLLGFGDGQRYLPSTDAVVDFGWSWYKSWMQRSAAQALAQEEAEAEAREEQATLTANGGAASSSASSGQPSTWFSSDAIPKLTKKL